MLFSRKIFITLTTGLVLYSPASVKANDEIESIKLANDFIEEFKYNFDTERSLENKAFQIKIRNNRKNTKSKNLAKKYGPLELGFKINPFNFGSNSVGLHLDLLKSYEILCSKPNSLEELKEVFKSDPEYNLIDPRFYKIIQGGLMPKEIWQTLSSLPSSS